MNNYQSFVLIIGDVIWGYNGTAGKLVYYFLGASIRVRRTEQDKRHQIWKYLIIVRQLEKSAPES